MSQPEHWYTFVLIYNKNYCLFMTHELQEKGTRTNTDITKLAYKQG